MPGEKKPENGVQVKSSTEAQDAMLGLDSEQDRRELSSRIIDALTGLKFGELTLVVQDGIVVQVIRTEKRRLVSRRSASR
jgi:hypothetical protein